MIELTMHRPHNAGLRPSVILLLTPLWVLITVAILLGLLGIFVLWLAVVGALISAIVATDLGQRFAARLARPPVGALRHGPVGYPGR
jgi:hypothetical protein